MKESNLKDANKQVEGSYGNLLGRGKGKWSVRQEGRKKFEKKEKESTNLDGKFY